VNAMLVPKDAPQAVATATAVLINDADWRMRVGAAARKTILARMDAPLVAPRIREAYDIALRESAKRGVRRPVVTMGAAAPSSGASADAGTIAFYERLSWAESLFLQRQYALATRTILRAWASRPTSTLPARFLARNVLPRRVTAALTAARHAASGR
jgi:hypothetical protein